MTTVAPHCPINNSQLPSNRRRPGLGGTSPEFPAIPAATDLPSLIRATNVLRDVLRKLTTSLTVNNVYAARQPTVKQEGNKFYSAYPNWSQVKVDTKRGYIYHKDRNGIDKTQRAYVQRINQVTYQNQLQEEADFKWNYVKKFDKREG